MILYHGSNMKIEQIDLNKCRPFKDFGQGFYCTAIEEQAELMAKRVARIYGGNPEITKFEFDESIFNNEKIKQVPVVCTVQSMNSTLHPITPLLKSQFDS